MTMTPTQTLKKHQVHTSTQKSCNGIMATQSNIPFHASTEQK